MTSRKLLLVTCLLAGPVLLLAQESAQNGGLDPQSMLKPLSDSWPTYSGDYTGRRYSSLTQVNQTNVKHLTLAWTARLAGGEPAAGGFGGFGRGGGPGGGGGNVIVGGEGKGDFPIGGVSVKGAILQVNGVLYVTSPDNVWALDARDGHELWRYFWRTKGGTHIGNRGAAMWKNYLYFETPDNYLVSLDARTGKERWHVEIADFNQQYFSTMAPIVIGDHVLVGTGNDLDAPGFLQSYDPETGKRKWIFYTVPMNPGDPGLETWPSLNAARHGGGQVWIPGVYDPETKLYIFGTGNPTPGYTGAGRKGDNLFTCSLVAVNVETGKMAWYFQTSPHDTHDWDSAQTPILIDGTINGKPRKLVSTASRNGYFFTVDRVTGEHVVTSKYGTTTNWAKHVRPSGRTGTESGEGSDHSRFARFAGRGWRRQLAAARLFPRHRSVLYAGEQRVPAAVSHGSRSTRLDGPRWQAGGGRRLGGERAGRDRLPDRQDRLAPRVAAQRWRGRGHADISRAGALHRRWQRQFRCVRCGQRQAALARAYRQHHECAADAPARRPAVRAGGGQRHALHLCVCIDGGSRQLPIPNLPASARTDRRALWRGLARARQLRPEPTSGGGQLPKESVRITG